MDYAIRAYIALMIPFVLFSQENDTFQATSVTNSKQISFNELTVEQGLSQNSVVSISQDSLGYMWFATQDGLNKYDGRTFEFYNKQFEDVTRPTYSKLGKTYIDNSGGFWIISNSGRLEYFNQEINSFNLIKGITSASCILQVNSKDFYVGTYDNGLFKINSKTKDTLPIFKDSFVDTPIYELMESDLGLLVVTSEHIYQIERDRISKCDTPNKVNHFSSLALSKDGTIWLGTFGNGLYFKTKDNKKFLKFEHSKLPDNSNIQDILVDKNNRLWLATYGDGAYIIDIDTKSVQHCIANKNDPYALHYDDVLCLYEDFTGTIWLGTDGAGLSYYDEHLKKFNIITNSQTPIDVHVDVVRAIAIDKNETMWLGTSGKGLTSINSSSNHYKTYTVQNSELSSDRIMSLLFHDEELWIGHQGKGLQIMTTGGKFRSFPDLEHRTIWKIVKDKHHQIWLCTRDGGLIQFDKHSGVINSFTSENSALTSNNIRTVESSANNQLWIGTEDNGLFVLNQSTGTIKEIKTVPDKIKSLYFDNDILWVGTNGNGLKAYDVSNDTVKTYTIEDGLSNNVIYGILPDENDNLWLSSNKGITRFGLKDDTKLSIENYLSYSGLQAFEFNTGAYYKGDNGQLYFGGLEGVNWFDPSTITFNKSQPKTVISKLEIFGKEREMIESPVFPYNQNTVTFTFAALHFSQPEQNLYKYKLVNHDADWSMPEPINVAHYTNLPPDTYTFMVMSSNYDGVWNKTPATYSFEILKPWYASNLAKFLYLIGILALIVIIYRYLKFRWEVKIQLKLEHAETERLKKLDEFKTKLYTNISHEFRTPLTLISGPIEHQLSKDTLNQEDRTELNLVKQNANRLLNLVNQMLDLSMIDSGQLRLIVSEGNLNILLKQIVAAFQYKADNKNITIISDINDLKQVWYDTDIIEKVASNLLSNAIKYAPENSEIIFDANEQSNAMVLSIINVNNTILQKDFGKLFQRFYQDDVASDGVGVGLALVKELVNLSKGSILANNIDDDKIQFTVTLPIHKEAFLSSEVKINPEATIHSLQTPSERETIASKPTLLIVEDNKDIRTFIVSIFKEEYDIIEANNGKVGIENAVKDLPDIIISDIMMPVQDGIELCNELKYNELTSHIPIILLTAKVGEENEIKGLKTGADAYITKPFNSEKLKIRVEKLIENRQLLQKHFSKDFTINPELAITSTEAEFLKRLKAVLDKEITNPEFTSERFAEIMQMSRTQLHRKLNAIVGISASEFIRTQRLKLALPLLKQSDATISEIAYQVGFNTPSYFIKCFKEVYGCTPNEYPS